VGGNEFIVDIDVAVGIVFADESPDAIAIVFFEDIIRKTLADAEINPNIKNIIMAWCNNFIWLAFTLGHDANA